LKELFGETPPDSPQNSSAKSKQSDKHQEQKRASIKKPKEIIRETQDTKKFSGKQKTKENLGEKPEIELKKSRLFLPTVSESSHQFFKLSPRKFSIKSSMSTRLLDIPKNTGTNPDDVVVNLAEINEKNSGVISVKNSVENLVTSTEIYNTVETLEIPYKISGTNSENDDENLLETPNLDPRKSKCFSQIKNMEVYRTEERCEKDTQDVK